MPTELPPVAGPPAAAPVPAAADTAFPAFEPPPRVALKAAALLVLFIALVGGTALYLLYARGVFEHTQRLVLVADDSEGVQVGMDMSFSGFPIARVRAIELAADGTARILLDVPRKDAHWLRTSSVFTLVRSLVGGASLRAYSGVLADPPLPDGAERRVLVGDTGAELPKVVSAARELVQNLTRLTAPDAALAETLANLQAATGQLKGPRGAAGLLLGNGPEARSLNAVLASTQALLQRLDGIAGRADTQLLGPEGLVREGKLTATQLNGLLAEVRGTLKKVDAVLVEAQQVAGNVRGATGDLDQLRNEVDATVRKVERLVDEVNRKWPLARDTSLQLK